MSPQSPAEQQLRSAGRALEQALLATFPELLSRHIKEDKPLTENNDAYAKILKAFQAWKNISFNTQEPNSHSIGAFSYSAHDVTEALIARAKEQSITEFTGSNQPAKLLHEYTAKIETLIRKAGIDDIMAAKQRTELLLIVASYAELLGVSQQYRLLENNAAMAKKAEKEPPSH